ncbi:glycosyltransferase 87 family protein [Agromyces sp. SYSU T0242]|uniref:glycosyltransferase 87 family protein n=1 Tax=Agromyces litoreus TaxID=3158561 RepID=UPI00339784B3
MATWTARSREARPTTARGTSIVIVVLIAAVAAILRAAPFAFPEAVLWIRENDDGVMYSGALALLRGAAPYADFDYVHPPGSLLLLAPFAALGSVTNEAVGLAGARLLTIAVGVANTVLIGMLLRRFGSGAIVIGAGAYAVWGTAVATERTYLLEPYLNLALLVALAAFAAGRRGAPVSAGIAIGLAVVVKFWAILDVLVIGALAWSRSGRSGLLRYLAAGSAAAAAVALPFLVRDPGAMWRLTVSAQLGRRGNDVDLAERADVFSPYLSFPALRELIPTTASALGVALLLAVAAVPLVAAARARRTPRDWPDEAWWSVITLAHALAIGLSAMFFYHYAAWIMAPLALSLGAAVGRLRRRRLRVAAVAAASAVLALMAAGDLRSATPTPSASTIRAWATSHDCVAGMPSVLVAADHVGANLAGGCPMDVDPLSLGMTLPEAGNLTHRGLIESTEWTDRWWSYVEGADGAAITADQREWFTPAQRERFEDEFRLDGVVGRIELWSRVAP